MARIEVVPYNKQHRKHKKALKENHFLNIIVNKKDILIMVIGFFVSRVQVLFNIMPLGSAYFAAAYNKNLAVSLLVLFGVVLGNISGVINFPIKYLLANVLFVAIIYIKNDFMKKSTFYTAGAMAVSVFVCGFYYVVLGGFLLYDFLMLIFESFVVFTSVFIFKKVIPVIIAGKKRTILEKEEVICLSVLIALIISGFANISLPGGINLKNIVGIYTILVSAICCGAGVSAAMGITIGLITSIGDVNMPNILGTYAFCGLISGVFSRFGKMAVSLSFLFSYVVMLIYLKDTSNLFINIIDIFIAQALIIFTPKGFLSSVSDFVSQNEVERNYGSKIRDIVADKLKSISGSFENLSKTFNKIAQKNKPINYADISAMFDMAAERVCTGCGLCFHCWEKNFDETYDIMFSILEKLELNGKVKTSDIPSHFAVKCGKIDEFLSVLNNLYELHKVNFLWKTKMAESRSLVSSQLMEVSKIIDNLAFEIDEKIDFDKEIENEIICRLDKLGVCAKNVTVIKNQEEKYEVFMNVTACKGRRLCTSTIEEEISDILERKMIRKEGVCSISECSLKFAEMDNFIIETGFATKKKNGSSENGDNFSFLELGGGKFMIGLSDGMGSGKKASKESRATLSLLENFLESGFDKNTAVKMINSVLVLKSNEESFATIDLSIINLKTAEAEFVKIGAAETFIKKSDKIKKITSTSLPVGILDNVDIEVSKEKLKANDYIIMMSDGVLDTTSYDSWVYNSLSCVDDFTPKQMADYLLEIAIKNKSSIENDDMTILVARILQKN